MRLHIIIAFMLSMICGQVFAADSQLIQHTSKSGYILTIKGAIGPAVADYIVRGIEKAEDEKAAIVIIEMDTPGGLAKSMRVINTKILASTVPVATYVAPSGARAASAGTFILYASHIAAMAPGTNLGAASPVSLGVPGVGESSDKKDKGATEKTTMQRKIFSDTQAYIRSLAELRKRNVEWAEKAVKEAASLTAVEAMKEGVIDYISVSVSDLLEKMNGRAVSLSNISTTINTDDVVLKQFKPDWRARFLSIITDPSIAYILMLIGIYGLFLEFTNPGLIFPGVVGAISLLLALYALAMLPINYVGLALIFLGIGFMIAEAFITSFGILGVGGVIAFIVGSVMLVDTQVPGYSIALPLIIALGFVSAGIIFLIANMAIRARLKPIVSGRENLLGKTAKVVLVDGNLLHVRIRGEIWQAVSTDSVTVGQTVKVEKMEGLVLFVKVVE